MQLTNRDRYLDRGLHVLGLQRNNWISDVRPGMWIEFVGWLWMRWRASERERIELRAQIAHLPEFYRIEIRAARARQLDALRRAAEHGRANVP